MLARKAHLIMTDIYPTSISTVTILAETKRAAGIKVWYRDRSLRLNHPSVEFLEKHVVVISKNDNTMALNMGNGYYIFAKFLGYTQVAKFLKSWREIKGRPLYLAHRDLGDYLSPGAIFEQMKDTNLCYKGLVERQNYHLKLWSN